MGIMKRLSEEDLDMNPCADILKGYEYELVEERVYDITDRGVVSIRNNSTKTSCTEHIWVSSGCPGGMTWCSVCDINYTEDLDGRFK